MRSHVTSTCIMNAIALQHCHTTASSVRDMVALLVFVPEEIRLSILKANILLIKKWYLSYEIIVISSHHQQISPESEWDEYIKVWSPRFGIEPRTLWKEETDLRLCALDRLSHNSNLSNQQMFVLYGIHVANRVFCLRFLVVSISCRRARIFFLEDSSDLQAFRRFSCLAVKCLSCPKLSTKQC